MTSSCEQQAPVSGATIAMVASQSEDDDQSRNSTKKQTATTASVTATSTLPTARAVTAATASKPGKVLTRKNTPAILDTDVVAQGKKHYSPPAIVCEEVEEGEEEEGEENDEVDDNDVITQ